MTYPDPQSVLSRAQELFKNGQISQNQYDDLVDRLAPQPLSFLKGTQSPDQDWWQKPGVSTSSSPEAAQPDPYTAVARARDLFESGQLTPAAYSQFLGRVGVPSISQMGQQESAGLQGASYDAQEPTDMTRSDAGWPGATAPAGQDTLKVAGFSSPARGLRPPIPPWLIPGTPQWTEQFIRGMQGLINTMRSAGRGSRGGLPNTDHCHDRWAAEQARCWQRRDDYAHRDFLGGCLERARTRDQMCVGNGGTPDPNEPKEWGPEDEEIWINNSR